MSERQFWYLMVHCLRNGLTELTWSVGSKVENNWKSNQIGDFVNRLPYSKLGESVIHDFYTIILLVSN